MGLQLHPDVISVSGVDLRTPDEVRADMITHVAQLRWGASQSFTLSGSSGSPLAALDGYRVVNSTDARQNVSSAISALQFEDAGSTRRWKFSDEGKATIWLDLDLPALVELQRQMNDMLQRAFDREESLTDEINASGDPNSVDVMTGWPA